MSIIEHFSASSIQEAAHHTAAITPTIDVSTPNEPAERPYPLCLLCLTRPPSAVLLPCCHLNLCHLCAPLLIQKASRAKPSPPTADSIQPIPPAQSQRIPFNLLLMNATASNPRLRKLAGGGYLPPQIGREGGEFEGCHLLPSGSVSSEEQGGLSRSSGDESKAKDMGFSARLEEGRVKLESSHVIGDGSESCLAKCLVCRSGVSGWLRVYTG